MRGESEPVPFVVLARSSSCDATRTSLRVTRTSASTTSALARTAVRIVVTVLSWPKTSTALFGVFSALMDVIIAGDHEPVALADRVEFIALDAIEDPRELLRAVVRVAAPILARLDVIYPTLRAAAASDPQVAEAHQRFTLDARYEQYRSTGAKLASLGALPDGMTASAAVDILWTVLSPDTYNLLVSHRGWSREQFVAWATDCVLATVVANRVPKKAVPKKAVRKRQAD